MEVGDTSLVRGPGGWGANASDKQMTKYARLILEREGLSVVPASTVGLIAMLDWHPKKNTA